MAPLAFILSSLLLSGLTVSADPVHVPLARRSRRRIDVNEEALKLKFKYGLLDRNATLPLSARQMKRADSVGIPVVNQVGTLAKLVPFSARTEYLASGR